MRVQVLLVLFLYLVAAFSLYGQEDEQIAIDDMFTQTENTVASDTDKTGEDENPPARKKVDLDNLVNKPLNISAQIRAGLGLGLGLKEWPGTRAAEGQDIIDLATYAGFYESSVIVDIDARPESFLRFKARLKSELDEEEMNFTVPTAEEMFIDYSVTDTFFLRAGKQKMVWGQGLLLENYADLVERVEDGVAVKGVAQLGSSIFEAVVYGLNSWEDQYGATSPRTFGYAARAEKPFGPATWGLAGHYHVDEPVQFSASTTFPLGSIDFAGDLVLYQEQEHIQDAENGWAALGRLFWENSSRSWSVVAEYEFNSYVEDSLGHYTGLAVKMPILMGNDWRPAIRWRHAYEDHSGDLLAGFSGTILPKLRLTLGIPLVYGSPGSYYRSEARDPADKRLDSDLIPDGNVVTVLVAVSLNYTF
jgi:hypothetical protein